MNLIDHVPWNLICGQTLHAETRKQLRDILTLNFSRNNVSGTLRFTDGKVYRWRSLSFLIRGEALGNVWTSSKVQGLAPDEASLKAAKGLTHPGKWTHTGCTDRAVWGECQGSGDKPYQTRVDLNGPAFKCSCPTARNRTTVRPGAHLNPVDDALG